MNKIQVKSESKTRRKRRIRAIALAQIAASKIPHSKGAGHSAERPFPAQERHEAGPGAGGGGQ
jgi:hypothetical protein